MNPSDRGNYVPTERDTDSPKASDRQLQIPKERKYDNPPISNRGLVVNNKSDSVQRYFSNSYSKPNPQNNNYKGPSTPIDNPQNNEYKGSSVFKDNPQNTQYNSSAVPRSNPSNIDYKGPALPKNNPTNNEYKGPSVFKDNPQNNNYRGPALSPDSVHYTDSGLSAAKKYNYFDKKEDQPYDSITRAELMKYDAQKHPSDRRIPIQKDSVFYTDSGLSASKDYNYFERKEDQPYDSVTRAGLKNYDSRKRISDRRAIDYNSSTYDKDKRYTKEYTDIGLGAPREYNEYTREQEGAYDKINDAELLNNLSKNDKSLKPSNRRAIDYNSSTYDKDKRYTKEYSDSKLGVSREYADLSVNDETLKDLQDNLKTKDSRSLPADRRAIDYYSSKYGKTYLKSEENYAAKFPDESVFHEAMVDPTNKPSDNPLKDLKFKEILNANNVFTRKEIDWYNKFNRFGYLDPYNGLRNTREYLFFTKPDLHILQPGTSTSLNPELSGSNFFVDALNRYPQVIYQLQSSAGTEQEKKNPFMCLLSNSVNNTLDLPNITAREIETASNQYGTSIPYRGSGYKSDEAADVSLEFEDSRYGEVLMLTKIYEKYSEFKDLGRITPPNIGENGGALTSSSDFVFTRYHKYKELHDRFSIYKIIVDEDYETILFWAKCIGCYFNNVPRDSLSDLREAGTLKYTIEIKVPFVRDMDPIDLYGFNKLIKRKRYSNNTITSDLLPVYTGELGNGYINGEWALSPFIVRETKEEALKQSSYKWLAPQSMQYVYKLKWLK